MTACRRAVTVLSGFLGSGKTTLLRRYLQERGTSGISLVINEFGAVGVDHHLVRHVEEEVVLIQGGCVCCSRREDLRRTFRELLDAEGSGQTEAIGQVIVETSGLADPVPVLFTLATDPVLKHHFAPASVVVTLDAFNAASQIERQPEVRKQIVAADRIVVTKTDLATPEAVAQSLMRVRQLNPACEISLSCLGDGYEALEPGEGAGHSLDLDSSAAAPHPDVQSTALGFSAPLDWPVFSVWLGMLLQARGPDVLRIKGLLDVGDAGPVALNVAQHVIHPPEHLSRWPDAVTRPYLVFITRAIDPGRIAESLQTFQRASGRADLSVVGLG